MEKEIKWLLKEKYSNKPTKQFHNDVKRLMEGEPLDYVIGFTEFLGCKIDLSKKPLIPRPETEFWVKGAIDNICSNSRGRENRSIRVLDIFSGSGCIGITILKYVKNAKVVFAEKDKKALGQIKINLKINNMLIRENKRIVKYSIIHSDIFENLKSKIINPKSFDYILANPPYIPTTRKNKIQKSVLKYEPKSALFGGKDGLLYIRKFLAKAKNFLNPNGKIFMEFDSSQKKQIEKLLEKFNYKNWEFNKDQYGKWRFIRIET